MDNLQLQDQGLIHIQSASLPTGEFVKIQPHSESFMEISNPKAVLENALRKFATLTKAEDFVIEYNKNKYCLRVVDIKPNNPSNAISIIEADISVDFAPALDTKQVEPQNNRPQVTNNSSGGLTFGGGGVTIPGAAKKKKDDSDDEESSDEEQPKFKAFAGMGARLDGKSGTPPKTMMGTSPKPSTTPPNNNNNSSSSTSSSSGDGKFVAFGGKGYSLK
eukprot:gene20202-24224_t